MTKATVFFTVLLFLPLFAIGTGRAVSTPAVKAEVPFNFYAGAKQLPAGAYTITIDTQTKTIVLRTVDGDNATFMMAVNVAECSDKSHLVFDRIGDKYFLKLLDNSEARFDFPVQQNEAMLAD